MGQTVAVTGGGRGIGRVIAQTFAAAGADVVVLARSASELAETVALIGSRARAVTLDVLDAAAISQAFNAIGPLDVLVNNAGDGGPVGPVEQSDPVVWWRTQEVNVRGPMLCTHAVLPGMIARRRGRIINMSSGAANLNTPYFSSYIISKAALNKMIELLATETKDHGVSFFAVSPGPVHTAMSEAFLKSPEAAKWMPWFGPMFAKNAVGPELAADLCVKLASGKYDSLSGKFISVADDLDKLVAETQR